MTNEFLDVCTSGLEILTRVKLGGLFVVELTDCTCHCKTEVGVDVDLTNAGCSSLAELFLRNTNCVRHLAAVFVDHLYIVLRNGR